MKIQTPKSFTFVLYPFVMTSNLTLRLYPASYPRVISANVIELRRAELGFDWCPLNCRSENLRAKKFVIRAFNEGDSYNQGKTIKSVKAKVFENTRNAVVRLQESVSSLPHTFVTKRISTSYVAVGICIATMFLVIVMRVYKARNSRPSRPGSVADLVRRGQLRSDRRGISSTLKYEDPFNNPMVKISKTNSTVEMCGKVYRLAPVTLTREQQNVHIERRSRAYLWKRPTIFLKEGDAVPPDVDPDTIRWIPANHPFATTVSDIDEDLAETNVYQKHGVPFRIKAEHEALQRKLESLQNDQKFSKLTIDPGAAKNFERPFKTQLPDDQEEEKLSNGPSRHTQSDHTRNTLGNNANIEDIQHT